MIGSILMAGAIGGYLLVYGRLRSMIERVLMFVAGFALIIPNWIGPSIGGVFLMMTFVMHYLLRRSSRGDAVS